MALCAAGSDNVMNQVWYPALRHDGTRERKPSQTRHTFATLAVSAGEAIIWVSHPNLTRRDGSAFDKARRSSGCRSRDVRRKKGRSYGRN
jgi:hypothetical protein